MRANVRMAMLGTKAETLNSLSMELQKGYVLPQVYFSVSKWEKQKEQIWEDVKNYSWSRLIVRSSAVHEDTAQESMAGKYKSIPDVSGWKDFVLAVNLVIESFGESQDENQILVQPMLSDVIASGVAFSVDPNTNGNYYVVNYDDITGSTSSITSGCSESNRLFYCFKQVSAYKNNHMKMVCECLKELEILFGQDRLDVEFAITKEQKLYVLQVRPLCMSLLEDRLEDVFQFENLKRIYKKIKRENQEKPFLFGNKVIYGVMPDWNPAEIIGIRPKPLALSIYKEIITDNIWAYQRHNYGYKNLRSFPLMVDFCGLPYIDVRVSFNSFIPSSLEDSLSEKLANYYLDRLEENPSKHDKVEFEIVFSCYTLELPEQIKVLEEYGFTNEEVVTIERELKNLTNAIIDNDTGLWKKDLAKIQILEERYETVMNSNLDKIAKVYWLLEDCKRYGTLPFAGLARAGFIAVQLLNSLVKKDIISNEEYQNFMNDVSTVSTVMNQDFKDMSKEAFIKKYGHLRPGTYEINSKRYDEAPDLYFCRENIQEGEAVKLESEKQKNTFKLSLDQMEKLKAILREQGLRDDILELFQFIKVAIEGREYAKFVFTKGLSEILKLFGEIGEEQGFSIDDTSFVNINIIKELYSSTFEIKQIFENSIVQGKDHYKSTKSIVLPPVILSEEDVFQFYYPDTQPNYITLMVATGEICYIDAGRTNKKIKDKILLIPSADPGFDWIFSHHIKGFITQFGGANSHMAIRAGELGIPAVIGVGEKKFTQLKKAILVEIDALGKRIHVLS